jgi:hypothetical protein
MEKLGSNLGPITAENQVKPGSVTQNQAKRINEIALRWLLRDQVVGGSNSFSRPLLLVGSKRISHSPYPARADCATASDTASYFPYRSDRATAELCADQRLPIGTTSQTSHGTCGARSSLCRALHALPQLSDHRESQASDCSQQSGRRDCRSYSLSPSRP